MNFKLISDYFPEVTNEYYISEYGDIYRRVRSYSGSYKVNIQEDGKSKQVAITKLIKEYLNTDITVAILKDVYIIHGVPYAKRYINSSDNGYKRIYLNLGTGGRCRYSIHKLVDVCFNNGDYSLNTHHIDCDKSNNHYTNLESVELSEHLREHKLTKNSKQTLKSFIAVHNGEEIKVTSSIRQFCIKYSINYRAIMRGYTGDRKWIFKDFEYVK